MLHDEDRRLDEEERKAGIRRCIAEGAPSAAWGTFVSGVFLTGFALLYNATDLQIGLLASLPLIGSLVQLPASFVLERVGSRKRVLLWSAGLARTVWVLALLIPVSALIHGPDPVHSIVGIQAVSSLAAGVAAVAWLSWLAALLPRRERGRHLGNRAALYAGTAMVAALAGGRFLDLWKGWRGESDPGGFLLLFAVAVGAGIVGLLLISRIPEAPRRQVPSARRRAALLRIALRDRNFLRLVRFTGLRTFGVTIASPFFIVYMIKYLHIPYTQIALFQAIHGVTNMIGLRLWGYLSDRFGNRPVLLVSCLGIGTLPFLWLFNTPGHYGVVPVAFFVGGLTWAGVSLAETNLTLKLAPPIRNATHIALYSTVAGLMGALGPVLGGLLSEAAKALPSAVWRAGFGHLRLLFVLSGVLRVGSALALRSVREPEELGVRRMLRAMLHPRVPSPILVFHQLISTLSGGRPAIEERLPSGVKVVRNGEEPSDEVAVQEPTGLHRQGGSG